MVIPRLRALMLTGLLGLALTGIASASGKSCREDSLGSRAVQLAACNGGFANLQHLAKVYQKRLGLSAGTAAQLADAVADYQALEDGRYQDRSFEPELRRIESKFILLLDQSPDDPTITSEVGWFYGDGFSLVPSPRLFDLVARSSNPALLASRLVGHGISKASEEILFAALAVQPEPAVLWHQAAQMTYEPSWRIAFFEEAGRRLGDPPTSPPVGVRAATAMAEELLEAELNAGLVPQALAAFQSLAPAIQSHIEQGSTGAVKAKIGGLPFEGRLRDLRLPLASAYLLAGDPQAAARWLAKVKPVSAAKAKQDSDLRDAELQRQVLARWLRPSPDDPFDLLTSSLAGGGEGATEVLAVARFAERERYPAVAAYCLGLMPGDRPEKPFEPARGILARVRAAADATRGEIEKLRLSLADEARDDREAARTALGPDPAAATMSRLLRAPAAVRFAERPLPDGIAPVELPADEIGKRQKAMASGMRLPAHFALIRAERQGDRAAAIGVSQDYDPVGEISSGAYWVLLSSDGGQTWDPPLYTGLRVNQPYVARAVSSLPLLAGDHLQVEVEIVELDPTRIYFPPIALAPKRTAKGLYLDISLDLLRKDSDGDSLTDLAEERLMTDPLSRDTDGDGLEDGVDPLPAIPLRREAISSSARALAAFLAETWNVDRMAIIEGIAEGPGIVCCAKGGVQTVDEKTLFVVADRGLFSALSPERRVVVLTPEEAEAAKQKFGPFFPQTLELFVFDRSGRRSYVVWSASWEGGQTLLDERPDGSWQAMPVMNWVT